MGGRLEELDQEDRVYLHGLWEIQFISLSSDAFQDLKGAKEIFPQFSTGAVCAQVL